jgi:hypothetical protein
MGSNCDLLAQLGHVRSDTNPEVTRRYRQGRASIAPCCGLLFEGVNTGRIKARARRPFRYHIEAAYTTMWEHWQRGESPRPQTRRQ